MPSFLPYALVCLYMGMTEEYDRSLTDMRDRYDQTKAFLYCNDIRSESNIYAKAVRNKITKDCHILWKEIQDEIHRHINFTAQHGLMNMKGFGNNGISKRTNNCH